MWIYLTIGSALMLGLYDVAKKQSLKKNSVMTVLFLTTTISAVLLIPSLKFGPLRDHLLLLFKAVLVTASWVSGLAAMKTVPLSTVSTIKASRPVFVLVFSILLFKEHLNLLQWAGSACAILSIWLLSKSSRKEGIDFRHSRGIALLGISVLTGVASALFDKYIMKFMASGFVQSWATLYIAVLMGILLLAQKASKVSKPQPFRWDWMLIAIAVCITIADRLYFVALSQEDAMLSMVSMIRRSSIIVPFIFGALVFKEKNIRQKGMALLVMLGGMVLITLGSI